MAIRWSSVSYFIWCMWSLWQHRLSAAGCWGNKASFQPQSLRPDLSPSSPCFPFCFSHLPFTSCPKAKAKCLSHNRLLYCFFSHCASHFLMWFADRPNPSGALVKWEVEFKLNLQKRWMPLFHAATWKNNASRGQLQSELLLTELLQTPHLSLITTFTPIEVRESMSNSRMTQLVHFASSNPEDSDLNLHFFNSINVHESSSVSRLLSHCLLFFPLQRNVHVLLCSPNKISYCRFIVHLHCMTSTLNAPYCAKV